MNSKEIRESFVKFFESNGHLHLPGSSLIPKDPTLLFTAAGMVPLKSYFLGEETPPSKRLVTVQKCLRTNDIDNVGYTSRHHTFFEMLGNFSIGDYFKEEAIAWSIEYITKNLGLPFDKLWVTIFREDTETREIWKSFGVLESKIILLGEEDNFWTMGPVGPCGPCSEIYFDRGVRRPGEDKELPGSEGERFLEFWNLVFTQFDRQPDGSLKTLKKKNIDTGMGLERITSILEDVPTDFETDLFVPVIKKIEEISHKKYGVNPVNDRAFKAISDHIRAVAFMISDGLLPGNEKRGYVLRRLIRRSALFGRTIGLKKPFLYDLIPDFAHLMGDAYPELEESEEKIKLTLRSEEQKFTSVLEGGFLFFEDKIAQLKDSGKKEFPGDSVFYLYDTLGFPVELSEALIKEYGLSFNRAQFDALMEEQREKARHAFTGADSYTERVSLLGVKNGTGETEFKGYSTLKGEAVVKAIIKGEDTVLSAQKGEKISLILDTTPFYGEKGGQVGDTGVIENDDFVFIVEDTKIPVEGLIVHSGYMDRGIVNSGDSVIATVDRKRRLAIMRAHTSTHILQAALRRIFDESIAQQGSQVYPDEFRFDFNFSETFPRDKIPQIEAFINNVVLSGIPISTKVMNIDEAKAGGALAFFEEKYGDTVRVVWIDDVSKELCGGTHVSNTNEIGLVVLTGVGAVASGVKRFEGLSGQKAFEFLNNKRDLLENVSEILGTQVENIEEKANELVESLRESKRELARTSIKLFEITISGLKPSASVRNSPLYIAEFENVSLDELRKAYDLARKQFNSGIVIFVSKVESGEFVIIARLSEDAPSAVEIFRKISRSLNLKGGGSERIAQGSSPEKHSAKDFLRLLE